jgi:tetratricopeptide (TPR) repeat protein
MSPLLALLAVISQPVWNITPGDEKKTVDVVCPVDGQRFQAVEMLVTNNWGGRDYDGCNHAYKTTPLEFLVWVCPSCRLAGRKKDFEAKLGDDAKKALLGGLKPMIEIKKGAKQAEIPGYVKYDLLAQASILRGCPPSETALAYLYASWSCRQQGAVSFDDFDEWETLRTGYGLNVQPMNLKRNRTDFELEVARKVEKDVEQKKVFGANKVLARYLAAYLYRKHGENAEAERWLGDLAGMKGENSVVDGAAEKMKASIALERDFQKKAIELYQAALSKEPAASKVAAEFAYLLGELHRRTGDLKTASGFYQKAVETADSEAVRKLAADQKAKVDK